MLFGGCAVVMEGTGLVFPLAGAIFRDNSRPISAYLGYTGTRVQLITELLLCSFIIQSSFPSESSCPHHRGVQTQNQDDFNHSGVVDVVCYKKNVSQTNPYVRPEVRQEQPDLGGTWYMYDILEPLAEAPHTVAISPSIPIPIGRTPTSRLQKSTKVSAKYDHAKLFQTESEVVNARWVEEKGKWQAG